MTPRQRIETLAPWMNVHQVAHRYQICRQTVYERVAKGKLPPPQKTAGTDHPRWSREELDRIDGVGVDERRYPL
jgi:predicted DNA-binding transcriptional regulator AlpA